MAYVSHPCPDEADFDRIKEGLGAYHKEIGAPPFEKSSTLHQLKDGDTILCEAASETVYKLLHISLLVTYAPYRGQGHARELLATIETQARKNGIVAISVSTATYQAPEFYLKCGFAEVARFPLGITHGGAAQDKIYFRKILNAK